MTAKRPLVWGDDTHSLREIRDGETLAGVPAQGGGVSAELTSLMAGGVAFANGTVAAGDAVFFQIGTDGLLRCSRASAAVGGHRADALAARIVEERVWFCQHGTVAGYTGLTPGDDVFLAVTAGGLTLTPPWEPGQFVQRLGVTLTESIILFTPGAPRLILA